MAILLCLAKNPEKQLKLREEILQVMPTKDTLLNESNTKHLPYLRAVIKEALRYYPNGTGSIDIFFYQNKIIILLLKGMCFFESIFNDVFFFAFLSKTNTY